MGSEIEEGVGTIYGAKTLGRHGTSEVVAAPDSTNGVDSVRLGHGERRNEPDQRA